MGSILENEIARTAGTLLWIELVPTVHARPRSAALPSARRRPPVLAPALWAWRAREPARRSGARRWERILPLIIDESSYRSGRCRWESGHLRAAEPRRINQGGYIGVDDKMDQGISSCGVDSEDTMTEDLANLLAGDTVTCDVGRVACRKMSVIHVAS